MAGYPDVTALQNWIGTSGDTTPLTNAVHEAIGFVEGYCGRVFVAQTATKDFVVKRFVTRRGRRLLFFEDLATLTSITNGDGEAVDTSSEIDLLRDPGGFTSSSLAYVLHPIYGVELRPVAAKIFNDGGDSTPVEVVGVWGVAATDPPMEIYGAVLEVGKLIYNQRTGGGAAVASAQNAGVFLEGLQMPDRLKMALEHWKRRAI